MIPIAKAAATAVLTEQWAIWTYLTAANDIDAVYVNMVNAMARYSYVQNIKMIIVYTLQFGDLIQKTKV